TSLGGLHRYARLSATDFDLPDSIFFAPPGDVALRASRPRERLTGRLLRETRRSAEALSHLKLEVGRLDRPPNGWMNPIVLRLALDGEAFATLEGGLAGDTRRVLAALFEEVQILGIVPGFTREEDMRVRASSRALERSEGPLSAMQRLVTGGSDDRSLEPWPFIALDALGGKFVIEGHGRMRGPYQMPTYSWCPPPDAPANTKWLGRQLVAKWGQGE